MYLRVINAAINTVSALQNERDTLELVRRGRALVDLTLKRKQVPTFDRKDNRVINDYVLNFLDET